MCVPKYSCHHLASRGLPFEHLWPRRPRPYPLATLTQVSSTVTRRKRKSSSSDLNRFNSALHTDALVAICSLLRDFGTQWAVSLRIPKQSCKIVETLPCEKCNAFAISSTLIRLTEYTRSRTWHDKGAVLPSGLKHVLKQGMKIMGVSVSWKWDRLVTYWLALVGSEWWLSWIALDKVYFMRFFPNQKVLIFFLFLQEV